VPPPLQQAPMQRRTECAIEPAEWLTWWHRLLRDPTRVRDRPWHLAPETLLTKLETFGDEPLRWATTSIRDRSPWASGTHQIPVREAVRRVERFSGEPFRGRVRIIGLAVDGTWVQLERRSGLVVASWDSLRGIEGWLPSALARAR
jgi:hypothetical protein